MHRRLTYLALVTALLLWGCNPASETVIPGPQEPVEMTEPIFTAEQIRDEWITGLTLVMKTDTPSSGAFERWTVLRTDETGAEIEFLQVDEQGNPAGPPRRVPMTWGALQSHGSFPKAITTREEAVRDTALGQLDGWLSTVSEADGTETVYFFAKSLPGAPVQMKVTKNGSPVLELAQVERNRPDGTEAEAQSSDPQSSDPQSSEPEASEAESSEPEVSE